MEFSLPEHGDNGNDGDGDDDEADEGKWRYDSKYAN